MTCMSSTIHRQRNTDAAQPAHFVAPFTLIGEAIYGAVEAVARFVDQAFWSVRIRARSRGTVHQLSRLDDEALEDIGLPRSEIRAAAHKLAENPSYVKRRAQRRTRRGPRLERGFRVTSGEDAKTTVSPSPIGPLSSR
jgi:uncharacterized protein YjiS (DUF1127 family)